MTKEECNKLVGTKQNISIYNNGYYIGFVEGKIKYLEGQYNIQTTTFSLWFKVEQLQKDKNRRYFVVFNNP